MGADMGPPLPSVSYTLGNEPTTPNRPSDHILVAHPSQYGRESHCLKFDTLKDAADYSPPKAREAIRRFPKDALFASGEDSFVCNWESRLGCLTRGRCREWHAVFPNSA